MMVKAFAAGVLFGGILTVLFLGSLVAEGLQLVARILAPPCG